MDDLNDVLLYLLYILQPVLLLPAVNDDGIADLGDVTTALLERVDAVEDHSFVDGPVSLVEFAVFCDLDKNSNIE